MSIDETSLQLKSTRVLCMGEVVVPYLPRIHAGQGQNSAIKQLEKVTLLSDIVCKLSLINVHCTA